MPLVSGFFSLVANGPIPTPARERRKKAEQRLTTPKMRHRLSATLGVSSK